MLKLGVNIDHVATIRQARYRETGSGEPDPIAVAQACEVAGCHGITAHLREDRRHIQDHDIWQLKEVLQVPLNFEMANTPEMVEIAKKLLPSAVCLVPEKREELTTEGGLDIVSALADITETTKRLQDLGIEVSLFIDPGPAQITASAQATAQAVELHTGAFAKAYKDNAPAEAEVERLIAAATQGNRLGLKINAGHGLNYQNISEIHKVPHLAELNIGHSIVSHAVTVGMSAAVKEMLTLMRRRESA
ncbi:MAG: Pyridoxine 5'-phosphate synthase [Verrucomicrobia subdivision 3 bacterium]|nr:Pyridoxine 5'-phosphate synthase [Limisphaerales bacterium]MCS1416500.1 Pyridoxine 5'-phosphate synthase [Limisphaerales bacterium]